MFLGFFGGPGSSLGVQLYGETAARAKNQWEFFAVLTGKNVSASLSPMSQGYFEGRPVVIWRAPDRSRTGRESREISLSDAGDLAYRPRSGPLRCDATDPGP
jgi:hypothetical protein